MNIIVNESPSQLTQRTSLSSDARQKVSFVDESQCFFDFTAFLNQDYDYDQASSVLKEEKRVVSTDTIGTAVPVSVPTSKFAFAPATATATAFHLTMRKNKSKSLSSLTRSGNLKSLVEQSQSYNNNCFQSNTPTPAVSEDCLSSSIQDEEMLMVHSSLNNNNNNIFNDLNSCGDSGSCSCSQQDQQITESSSMSSTCSSSTIPVHTSCTGWGQFVDFTMPSERVVDSSSRGKLRSPTTRKRSSSLSLSSSRHSKYRLQKYYKDQLRRQKRQSPTNNNNSNNNMYNKNNNNPTVSITTKGSDIDMADAFKNKLSITQK